MGKQIKIHPGCEVCGGSEGNAVHRYVFYPRSHDFVPHLKHKLKIVPEQERTRTVSSAIFPTYMFRCVICKRVFFSSKMSFWARPSRFGKIFRDAFQGFDSTFATISKDFGTPEALSDSAAFGRRRG